MERAQDPAGKVEAPGGQNPAGPARSLRDVLLAYPRLPALARDLLSRLVSVQLVSAEALEPFLAGRVDRIRQYTNQDRMGEALVQADLLTRYQLERVRLGKTHGLLLGNYRVLDELGQGGMGVVYRAEHRLLKRQVAIKVLPVDDGCPPAVRQRFYSEMRVLAELSDPNIVLALDAGELPASAPNSPDLIYLVMELVPGGDLERYVTGKGPCSIVEACGYLCQAARGLQAAHDRHLIHRDVKPSNLLLTANGTVKLVDFGLARQFTSRLTDQRVLLGSIEFMPPEQSHDPTAVGREADLYGLGATLFWLLTGEGPYPYQANIGSALRSLQTDSPRRVRDLRADVPPELDELIAQMLDRNPASRPGPALAVANALTTFLAEPVVPLTASSPRGVPAREQVLLIDADAPRRARLRGWVEEANLACCEVSDLVGAAGLLADQNIHVVLLDCSLVEGDVSNRCRRLREGSRQPHLQIILMTTPSPTPLGGQGGWPAEVDDLITGPASSADLQFRIEHAQRFQAARNRVQHLAEQLLRTNQQLQQNLAARTADLYEAHNALLFAMARMAECEDGETPGHLRRMQQYCRILALEAAHNDPWAGLIDDRFLEQLERCVPLHDIGKIGLPDDIQLKPASLSPSERSLVETHVVVGDRILESLAREYGAALDFLGMARVIVRHHHERYDGQGYPDRLAGEAIPPAARIVALADVYDALRRMRLYKPALNHQNAVRMIMNGSPGQFDPTLVEAFGRCHDQFERVYHQVGD
jgi:response regulator RpfG family c-di-GMP phosphodiesterase